MKKALQKHQSLYPNPDPDQVIHFLEDFRNLLASSKNRKPSNEKSKPISIRIDPQLLTQFKAKCAQEGIPYQTQIKILMRQWMI